MDGISIAAASGMKARMESLELLANNLANVETGGFKADREFYSLYSSLDSTPDPQTGDRATLPVIESHWTDLAQGDFHATGDPLDFAIDGDGLFSIQTPRGVRYTRNGSFRVSALGILTTSDGSPVRAKGGGQITVAPGSMVEVLKDGTVRQNGQSTGQLELTTFDPRNINKEGNNYWNPLAGAAPKAAKGALLQGKLEASNVGGPESAVRLVAILRQFEMLQKAMSIGNDLNKRAIEEVARVQS